MRIITKGMYPLYEVAYGESQEAIKTVEWAYIVHELPSLIPKNILNNDELATKWVVAHFTQVAFTAQGIPEEKPEADEEDEFPQDSLDLSSDKKDRESVSSLPSPSSRSEPSEPAAGSSSKRVTLRVSTSDASAGPPSLTRERSEPKSDERTPRLKKKSILEKGTHKIHKNFNKFQENFKEFTGIGEKAAKDVVSPPTAVLEQPAVVYSPPTDYVLKGTIGCSRTNLYICLMMLNLACICSRDLPFNTFVIFLALINGAGLLLGIRANKLAPVAITMTSKPATGSNGPTRSRSGTESSKSDSEQEQAREEAQQGSTFVPGNTMIKQPYIEEWMDNSFSEGKGTDFSVRTGPNYKKMKTKQRSLDALYDIESVDIFESSAKVYHVAQRVQLAPAPAGWEKPGGCPYYLVVNLQLPLYSPPIMSKVDDGKGLSCIAVLKMNERGRKELESGSTNAAKLIRTFLEADNNPKERARLKAIPRLVNDSDIDLGMVNKLVKSYNAKPFMTGPVCHKFFPDPQNRYLEVDIDFHKFVWPARRGIYAFTQDTAVIRKLVIDFGLVVQGDEDDELPEQMLACWRLSGVDLTKVKKL